MDAKYFESYEDIEVHRLMVKDKPRTEAYKDAILKNEHLFCGKVVMDVGAGTGIISLFLAKAGAKKVYAIEASSIAEEITAVARENGFSEVIEAYHTKIEDFTLPTEEKVDVIVSEWMGFYLLHESMLSSVLYARDNFLAEEGTLFPSEARLYAAPCSLETYYDDHFYFWDDTYGFNMSAIKERAFKAKSTKPAIYSLPSSDLLAEPVCIKTFNLRFISEEETEFSSTNFVGISKSGCYQGLAIWFVCDFNGRNYNVDGKEFGRLVSLSTSPFHPETHWKQTVIIVGPLLKSSVSDEVKRSEVGRTLKKPRIDSSDSETDAEQEVAVGGAVTEHLVEEDEIIGWELKFQRCTHNRRHYNIALEMLDPEMTEHPIPCVCPMPRCLIIVKMIENDDKEIEESSS